MGNYIQEVTVLHPSLVSIHHDHYIILNLPDFMGLLPALLLFYYNRPKESINSGGSSKFMTFVICDLMRQSFGFGFYWSQDFLVKKFLCRKRENLIKKERREEVPNIYVVIKHHSNSAKTCSVF